MDVKVELPQGDLSADAVAASLMANAEGQEDTTVEVDVKQAWNVEVEDLPTDASEEEVLASVYAACGGPDNCEIEVRNLDRRRALRHEPDAKRRRLYKEEVGPDNRRRLFGVAINLAIMRKLPEGGTTQSGLPFSGGLSVRGSVSPVGSDLQAVSAEMKVTKLGGAEEAAGLTEVVNAGNVVGNLAEDLALPAEALKVEVTKPIFPPMPPPFMPPSPPSPPPPSPPPPSPPPRSTL